MIPMHTPLLSQRSQSTSIFIAAPSAKHLDGYVVVPGHILHIDALQAVPDHLVAGHEVEQLVQRDSAFHPCQRRAQTAVNPVAEPEILRLSAIAVDVEYVRVGECLRITVCRGAAQEYRLACGNHAATDASLFEGVADVVLNRSLVAQQFFDRRRNLAAIVQ